MKTEQIKDLFSQGEENLKGAENELYRPSSDVVNYAVCVNGRKAIHYFMTCLYLYYCDKNNDTPAEDPVIEEMLKYCKQYNETLKEMDFSQLNCMGKDVRKTDDFYCCNDVKTVSSCTKLASDARTIFVNEAGNGNVDFLN